ncbi:MAG: hypothetical protein ACJ785_13840 [Gemmatimonadaceae bacterium]
MFSGLGTSDAVAPGEAVARTIGGTSCGGPRRPWREEVTRHGNTEYYEDGQHH